MSSSPSSARPLHSNYRWIICGLLFFSTTCNYLDRQVISYLKEFFCLPVAQGGFGWSEHRLREPHLLVHLFLRRHDRDRRLDHRQDRDQAGLALSLTVWSVFGILNAFVGRPGGDAHRRSQRLRRGRGGQFSRLDQDRDGVVPPRERALATGIFNSGSNVGPMIAALLRSLVPDPFRLCHGAGRWPSS